LTVQSDPVTAPQLDPAQVVAPALPAPAAPAEAGGAAPLSADEVQTLQSLLTRMSATDPPYVTTEPPA
jgi:hypothetical protein